MRLRGKRALVTAAGQGIGRASALALADEGAEVWATDIDESLLESLCRHGQRHTAPASTSSTGRRSRPVRDPAGARRAVQLRRRRTQRQHDGSDDDELDFAFDLNVRAQLWTIQAALPGMLAAGRGSIINMASIASSIKGLANRCVYGTTKAAVIGLTKAVAADYVGQGIRCNALCPGTVDTPSLGGRISAYDDPVAARKAFVDRQPMGRLAQAEEIAPMVVYLASDESTSRPARRSASTAA